MTNTVAGTILEQLGGNRFLIMTGARNLVASDDTLSFHLPRMANGINRVSVTLEIDDTYRVTFGKWNARKLETVIVYTSGGIYCDMLRELFENQTGLATSL